VNAEKLKVVALALDGPGNSPDRAKAPRRTEAGSPELRARLALACELLLLMNGEHKTMLNVKHALLRLGQVRSLGRELGWLGAVSLRFKKAKSVWHYRSLLVAMAFASTQNESKEGKMTDLSVD
jgi:hypothetical protein